jgi:hypothetical protein
MMPLEITVLDDFETNKRKVQFGDAGQKLQIPS